MNPQEMSDCPSMKGKWSEFTVTDERHDAHSWLYGTITLNGKLYNCVLQGKYKYLSYYEDTKYNQLFLCISPDREGDPITVAGVDYEVDGLFLTVHRTEKGHLYGHISDHRFFEHFEYDIRRVKLHKYQFSRDPPTENARKKLTEMFAGLRIILPAEVLNIMHTANEVREIISQEMKRIREEMEEQMEALNMEYRTKSNTMEVLHQ